MGLHRDGARRKDLCRIFLKPKVRLARKAVGGGEGGGPITPKNDMEGVVLVLADLLKVSTSMILSRICLLFGQIIDFLNGITPLRPKVGVRFRELSDSAAHRLWGVFGWYQ